MRYISKFGLMALLVTSFTMSQAIASCPKGSISIDDVSVRESCKKLRTKLPMCIPLKSAGLYSPNGYIFSPALSVDFEPTVTETFEHPITRRPVEADVYEFIYVADSRGTRGYGLVGVIAARFDKQETTYKNVGLFKKATSEQTSSLPGKTYNRFHDGDRVRIPRKFRKWRSVAGYAGLKNDTATKRQFSFADNVSSERFSRQSMLLRHLNGGVSCIRFVLAHQSGFSRSWIKAFSDGVPTSQSLLELDFDQ